MSKGKLGLFYLETTPTVFLLFLASFLMLQLSNTIN